MISGEKKRFEFIENADGSVTFIERFYIERYIDRSISNTDVIKSEKSDRPIAIGVTVSTIRIEDGKIKHDFTSDKIILADRLGENLFDEKDGVIKKYSTPTDEIEAELNNDIALRVLKSKVDRLSKVFHKESAESLLKEVNEITENVKEANWLLLESIIKSLTRIINSQTSAARVDEIEAAKKEKTDLYERECREADTYSGQVVTAHPDKQEARFQFTDEEQQAIIDSFQHTGNADALVKSENFTALNDLLTSKVIPKANEQRFYEACSGLQSATDFDSVTQDTALKAAGREVLHNARKAVRNGMVTPEELPTLTRFINGTKNVVCNPESAIIKKHEQNTEEAIGINRNWGKLIGGAMLSFLGVVLIAASVAVAVATFGVSTPLSAAGLALGGSIIAAGVTVGAAALVGVSLATSAGIFADRGRKGDIAVSGERVTQEAKIEKRSRKHR